MHKQYRLTQRNDFNKVYRFGKSMANRQFVVYVLPHHDTEHFKLGISISKKVGHAVLRNRLKRQIKEIVRHESHRVKRHVHIVIIARNPTATMEYEQLRKSLIHVFKKAQLWQI